MQILIVDASDNILAASPYPLSLDPSGVLRGSAGINITTSGRPSYLLLIDGDRVFAEARFGFNIGLDKPWQEAGNIMKLDLEFQHTRGALV